MAPVLPPRVRTQVLPWASTLTATWNVAGPASNNRKSGVMMVSAAELNSYSASSEPVPRLSSTPCCWPGCITFMVMRLPGHTRTEPPRRSLMVAAVVPASTVDPGNTLAPLAANTTPPWMLASLATTSPSGCSEGFNCALDVIDSRSNATETRGNIGLEYRKKGTRNEKLRTRN